MGNHKFKPIMKIIEGNAKLQALFDKMEDDMLDRLKKTFQNAFGVPLPTSLVAPVLELDTRIQYTTTVDLDDITKGATNIITNALEEDYTKVALEAVKFVSNFIEQALGSGSLSLETKYESSILRGPNGEKFVACIVVVSEQCDATQWFTSQSFIASKYVLAIWSPSEKENKLLTI